MIKLYGMRTEESRAIDNAIKERFFEAIRMLLESKALRGRQTYCRLYDINKRHFYAQEKDITMAVLKPFWLVPLVLYYNISAEWLLTGKGGMFKPDPKPRKERAGRYKNPPAPADPSTQGVLNLEEP